jgi:hypothetical protein
MYVKGFFRRARLPAIAGVAAALLIAGIAAGAAGQALILGEANDSGTSQTTLSNAGLGAAFTLRTTNVSTNATGIFGWSSQTGTNATRGVYGRADGANSFGVYAVQNSGANGTGAAIYADGGLNNAVVAFSDDRTAIVGTADCTGLFCGANGVAGTGGGFAAGVFGDGEGSIAGVWAQAASTYDSWGVYATSSTAAGLGVYGYNASGNAVKGDGMGAADYSNCGAGVNYCSGGLFRGDNGVIGVSGTTNGVGAFGVATTADAYGIGTNEDAYIGGDLFLVGTCTGCTSAALASNGGTQAIRQGDAVTMTGVTTSPDGHVILVVQLAKKGDAVLGIADRALSPTAKTVSLAATKQEIKTKFGSKTVSVAARKLEAQLPSKFVPGGTTAAAGAYLRVITSGVFAYEATSSLAAGDKLAVGANAGKLDKAAADATAGSIAGKFLGKLKDGRVVVLVSPS